MTYQTHMAGAVCLILLTAYHQQLPPDMTLLSVPLAALGGILPDLDHPDSFISHHTGVFADFIQLFTKHRGALHTPLFWLIPSAALYYFVPYGNIWVPPLFIGILSHILLDALNPQGVPVLWPLWRRKIHILRIPTRSTGEMFVYVPLLTLAAAGTVLTAGRWITGAIFAGNG